MAVVRGDLEKLRELAAAAKSNVDSIVTWRARVTYIKHFHLRGEPVESHGTIDFCYESSGDQLRFASLAERRSGGTTRRIHCSGLRTVDEFIRSGPYEEDASGFAAHVNLIERDTRKKQARGPFSPDFDPFVYLFFDRSSPADDANYAFEHGAEIPYDFLVSSAGTQVKYLVGGPTEPAQWIHQFEIAQGGMPLYARGGKVGSDRYSEWSSTYEQVSGVWVPNKTRVIYYRPDESGADLELTWTGHVLNVPIDPSEFTLQSLRPLPGNTVIDRQAQTQSVVDLPKLIEKFPQVQQHPTPGPARLAPATTTRTWFAPLLITNGVLLSVLGLLWWFRGRQPSRVRCADRDR